MKLELCNVSKKYKRRTVLDNVSMSAKEGIYGLFGVNGAGKSTVMKLICGIISPSSGYILIDDNKWSREHIKNMGALIEHPALYENLTAAENIRMIAGIREKDADAAQLLDLVGLESESMLPSKKYSVGMKQRLGIAMALIGDPDIIILDEPFSGLDPIGIVEIKRVITGLRDRGKTVIVSDHNLNEFDGLVDRIGIISCGKMVYEDNVTGKDAIRDIFFDVVGYDENS